MRNATPRNLEAPRINAPSLRQPPLLLTEVYTQQKSGVLAEAKTPPGQHDSAPFLNRFAGSITIDPYHAVRTTKRNSRTQTSRSGKRSTRTTKQRLNVLVVDDVADVTEMIALLLKHAGYRVETAESARAALQLAEARKFDFVISDIGMPEMNGYELATALRQLRNYRAVPIIAVTGYSEFDDRGRALNAGFNAHLTKPIEPSQLLNLMNKLLS